MPSDMKERIAREFIRLARAGSIDRITVKDIVEACHITRQTFYYHFRDLLDVIDWSLRRTVEELAEKSLQLDSRQQVMELFLTEAVQAKDLIRRLLDSQLREQTERLLVEAVRAWFQEMADRRELLEDVSRADAQVALDFYSYAVVGILLEYCGRPRLDVKRLAGQLTRLMDGSFQKELED